ncbi:MAG: biotin transporter BioY [Buchananella hordeovulneris]|nr:biotin transporter BioY [Buchananella hordeovulneris]
MANKTASVVLADSLLGGKAASLTRNAALVLTGTLVVALLSQVRIPLGFTPVPLSLGTLGVMGVGAVLGSRRGTAAVGLYALLGVLGAPVFAGFKYGITPTFGYILGYVAAAFLVGLAAERRLDRSVWKFALVCAGASALVYVFGVSWMVFHTSMPVADALSKGAYPFLVGDALKSAFVALVLPAIWAFKPRSK